MKNITWDNFKKIEIRVGTIIETIIFLDAKKPVYKLKIDLDEKIGIKKSSAQIRDLYSTKELLGKQMIIVVNLIPKKIGQFISECLITGFYIKNKNVILAIPDTNITNGALLV